VTASLRGIIVIRAATVAGFLESVYLVENFGLSSGYVTELRRAILQFSAQVGHEVPLTELSPTLVCRFLESLLLAGCSPTTVNNKRRMLLTIWRAAHRAKMACRPSARRIKKMVEPVPIPTAWTPVECGRIFAACQTLPGSVADLLKGQWWLSLFLTVYSTGERIRAIRNVLTRDCDLDAGTLLLRWQTVKTRKNRLVWLLPESVEAIRSIHDPHREKLWPWPHGKRHFFRQARKIIESAGVPCPKSDGKNLFQRMRRTSGSLIEAAGGDGARHLGNSREVFEKHYRAASLCGGSQINLLPSPTTVG
jgi:integrase